MPDWLILTLKILAGPLLGAVIGYFTNLIAVKMLFRPKKAKYIGKLRLPFTPGLIPKRKSALARALGNAVATRLVTASDMQSLFAGEEAAEHAGKLAARALFEKGQTLTLSDIAGEAKENAGACLRRDKKQVGGKTARNAPHRKRARRRNIFTSDRTAGNRTRTDGR